MQGKYKEGVEWLNINEEFPSTVGAADFLSILYLTGNTVERDYEKVYEIQKNARYGGFGYYNKKTNPEFIKEIEKLLDDSSRQAFYERVKAGDPSVENLTKLWTLRTNRFGVDAVKILKIKAENEDSDSEIQLRIARVYFEEKNREEGIKWLRKSAAQGNEEAQEFLIYLEECLSEEAKKMGFSVIFEASKDKTGLENRFLISPKGEKLMILPNICRGLNSVNFYKDKVIINVDSQYGQVIIITTLGFEAIDSLLCFSFENYMQSPSGRYLLFRKFHPRSCPEAMSLGFLMIYDLEKSPQENRYHNLKISLKDITIENSYVGKYFFPNYQDFEHSATEPYNISIGNLDNYLSIRGLDWKSKKAVLHLKYPKTKQSNFLLVEEIDSGLKKEVLKFKDFKIYDKSGSEIIYDESFEGDFHMGNFEFIDGNLNIYNSSNKSDVSKITYRTE